MEEIKITLQAYLYGPIWVPMYVHVKWISVDLKRERSRITPGKGTLRDAIDLVMMENGGDFRNCQLTKDSEIQVSYRVIRPRGGLLTRSRFWNVTAFPSIADFVGDRDYADLAPELAD
jgi:hypothetical protein